MAGLCGWLGAEFDLDETRRRVTEMAAQAAPVAGSIGVVCGRRAALAVSDVRRASLAQQDQCLAAVVGHPQWGDAALAEHAQRAGNAAALIAAWQQLGEGLWAVMRGDFAAVVIDEHRAFAGLAVDAVGIRPLAYARVGDSLVFASSLDALLPFPGFTPQIDHQAILHYLYFDMIPSPGTIYRRVSKLEPAQRLHRNAGDDRLDYHWLPAFQDHDPAGFAGHEQEFALLLRNAVQRCAPDRDTGAFLSGGLDSSTVSGMYAQLAKGRARSYSMGFDAAGYDEIAYARIAAKRFALDAREYYVTPQDVVSALPLIARSYDEPFGNSSALPVYWCGRVAAEDGIRTLLAGDGGDELFAGNERYAKQKVFEFYARLPAWLRRGLLEPVVEHFPAGRHIPPVRKLGSYIRQANIPLPERLQTYNPMNMTPLPEMLVDDFLASVDPGVPLRMLETTYRRAESGASLNRMLYLDWKITLADNDLRKVNRMCEVSGVEVRYPMLDPDLIEFSTRIPVDLKLKGFRLRHYFKHALRDFLPREIINKPKHGFGLPFGVWLKDHPPLQELANDHLASFRRRGYVRPEYIDRLLHRHRTEHAAFYGTTIWTFMMLEMWLAAHRL